LRLLRTKLFTKKSTFTLQRCFEHSGTGSEYNGLLKMMYDKSSIQYPIWEHNPACVNRDAISFCSQGVAVCVEDIPDIHAVCRSYGLALIQICCVASRHLSLTQWLSGQNTKIALEVKGRGQMSPLKVHHNTHIPTMLQQFLLRVFFMFALTDTDWLTGKTNPCCTLCYIILYADDILLISPSVSTLEHLLHTCEIQLNNIDMVI